MTTITSEIHADRDGSDIVLRLPGIAEDAHSHADSDDPLVRLAVERYLQQRAGSARQHDRITALADAIVEGDPSVHRDVAERSARAMLAAGVTIF